MFSLLRKFRKNSSLSNHSKDDYYSRFCGMINSSTLAHLTEVRDSIIEVEGLTDHGITLGDSRKKVLSKLGSPDHAMVGGETGRYHTLFYKVPGSSTHDLLEVHLFDDKVFHIVAINRIYSSIDLERHQRLLTTAMDIAGSVILSDTTIVDPSGNRLNIYCGVNVIEKQSSTDSELINQLTATITPPIISS